MMSNFGFSNFNLNFLIGQAQHLLKMGTASSPNAPPSPSDPAGSLSGMVPMFQPGAFIKEGKLSLAALSNEQSFLLTPQEVSLFLKEALKLPQEIRLILLMLAFDSSSAEVKDSIHQNLRQLIEQNLEQLALSPDEVQKMLDKNSKHAMEGFIKLLQGSMLHQARSSQQIGELMSSLGKLSEKIKASPAEALETLLLLYIPWYPLSAQQKMELSFELGEGSGNDGEQDTSIVIYLQTNTLGRFKIIVTELDPLQIAVRLFHEEIAREILPRIEQKLNETLAQEGLPAAILDSELIQEEPEAVSSQALNLEDTEISSKPESLEKETSSAGFRGATRQEDHQRINVQPGDRVSLLVLNTAYTLARFIFELDEANRSLQKRA